MRHWKKITGWTLVTVFVAVGSLLAQDPVSHLQYMVGEKATILNQLQRQGYSYVRGTKEGGGSYSYYRDQRSGECIVARTFDGRVASIVNAPEFDCRNQQGSGSGWGGGSSSSSYGVTLYRDLNFSGRSETFSDDVSDLRSSYVGNDNATSVRVSRGCRARLYADANYRGSYLEVDRDISDLRGTRVGNDTVTSVQVRCDGSSSGGGWGGSNPSYGVTLYRDLNFQGAGQSFSDDVADLGGSRVGSDTTTSVRVGQGCRARLYADAYYRGAYLEVDRDISDLRGTRVGNDTVTSVQVRCDGSSSGGGWGGGSSSSSYGVTLYRDLNFSGRSETFSDDVSDLRSSYVGNDNATSVRISRGCRARLYADANYRGAYLEVDRDISDLRGTRVGNDTVSSVQVRCER